MSELRTFSHACINDRIVLVFDHDITKFLGRNPLAEASNSSLQEHFLNTTFPSKSQIIIGVAGETFCFVIIACFMSFHDRFMHLADGLNALACSHGVERQSLGLYTKTCRSFTDTLWRKVNPCNVGFLLKDAKKINVMR